MTLPEPPDLGYGENFNLIVASAPDLRRASFHGEAGLLHHSSTIKLVPLSKLINGSYPSLRVPQKC
jgi:hypothetical protein